MSVKIIVSTVNRDVNSVRSYMWDCVAEEEVLYFEGVPAALSWNAPNDFVAQAQLARLSSGLIGARIVEGTDDALTYIEELFDLSHHYNN